MSMIEKAKLLAEMKHNPDRALGLYCNAIGKSIKDNLFKSAEHLKSNATNSQEIQDVANALETFAVKTEKNINDNLLQVFELVLEDIKQRNKK